MSEKKEKCIIFALAGILLLIVCMPVKKENKEQQVMSVEEAEKNVDGLLFKKEEQGALINEQMMQMADLDETASYADRMEDELEALLQDMEGVGRAKVMITLRSTSEEIVEKDRPANRSSISENDSSGGSRSTNDMDNEETTVFVTDAEGRQIPYVRKTLQPVVEGVAVLAEGGGTEKVRINISEAIQALFGIDANKIKIAKMKTIK